MNQPQLGMPDYKIKALLCFDLSKRMAVAMYVFSRTSLYKTESAIFQLKLYDEKDNIFFWNYK